MRAQGTRRVLIFSVVAVLLIFTNHGESAGRAKRRRCMAVKNEWRSKGFGDNQQVPSSPVSGKHIYWPRRCQDTSHPGHWHWCQTVRTLRHQSDGAEMSWVRSVLGLKCLDTHFMKFSLPVTFAGGWDSSANANSLPGVTDPGTFVLGSISF